MAIVISYPDKLLAGLWQSCTITSDEGPPDGEVLLDGKPLDRKLIPLRPPLWKVSFLLPGDAAGKTVTLRFRNAGSMVDEAKPIEAA